MKNPFLKTIATATLAGIMLAGGQAFADYNKLVDTLVAKGSLTAEEAAKLKVQPVKPASKFADSLAIRGRVQTQFAYVDAKNDNDSGSYSTFEVRRARIGVRGEFPNKIRAEVEMNVLPEETSTRSAYIQWREHKFANVKVGYDKPLTSMEENTSSASIITIERSNINNTLAAPGETTGLLIEGDLGTLYYGAGIFTNQDNRNADYENSEYLYNAMLGINLDGALGEGSKLKIQGHYLSSDDTSGNFTYDGDLSTLGFHLAQGSFDLRAEYFMAEKAGDETTGFYIMPSVMLTEKLQGVLRFEQSESDKSSGISAPSRYLRRSDFLEPTEVEAADGKVTKTEYHKGDEFMALYLGVNYYFKGDGSKLMFGVEFSELDNTKAGKLEGTTLFTAWRTLF